MALDKTQNASPIDPATVGAITTGMAVVGVPPEQVLKVNQAASAVAADPGAWFRNLANTIMKALGAKSGINTVEPTKSGEASTTQKTALAGVPEKQALATDTAAKAAGPKTIQAALMPILTFIQGGVVFFLNNGGISQLLGMLNGAQTLLGTAAGFGAFGASVANAIQSAMAAHGKTIDDLKTDKGLAAALGQVTVPPTAGVNNAPMPLADYLARVNAMSPAVGVPARPGPVTATAATQSTTTMREVAPGVFSSMTERTQTRPSSPPASTELVPPRLTAPPKVDLVSTTGFAHDPNPFKTFGNPAAALENEVALARDLNALAGKQDAIASAAGNISAAADKFIKGQYDKSLALSLRALIKGLATYNLQSDVTLDPTLVTKRSLRWWNEYLPPARILDPAIIAKIADGQTLSPAEITAYNTAMSQLTTKTVEAVSNDRRFPAMPGTLVYAALREDPYPGTLDDLVTELPERIALREGLSAGVASLIHDITFQSNRPDSDLEQIPDLLQGADPRIQQYQGIIRRWIQTVTTFHTSAPGAYDQYLGEVGNGPLTFVTLCRQFSLNLSTLYTNLLHDRLLLSQRLELDTLVTFWDQLAGGLDPDAPTAQGAKDFLHEIMAAKDLLGAQTLTYAVDQFDQGVLVVGDLLGLDMVYATSTLAAMLRAEMILNSNLDTSTKTSRVKAILTTGNTFSASVQHFPNPGVLKRISEVI